jgi:hypothetical protein
MDPHGAPKTHIEPGVKIIIDDRTYTGRHNSVLGREGTIAVDYFEKFSTVSRRHAKITKDGGRWFITVPASVANSTMLDGIEVKRDQPYPIVGEHILKLSEQVVVRLKL